jgi:DNA-binding CsgD family transcriptional regulator/cbb3-type cytochrome oxidase subunit 3
MRMEKLKINQNYGWWHTCLISSLLIIITVYSGFEVKAELVRHSGSYKAMFHGALEIGLIVISLILLFYFVFLLRRKPLADSGQFDQANETSFQKAVNEQFTEWRFTSSEKQVAMLLLKGLSVKEIADVRHVQEKTVHNQLSTIYDKSQLSGRHVFAARFFEDLL